MRKVISKKHASESPHVIEGEINFVGYDFYNIDTPQSFWQYDQDEGIVYNIVNNPN